MKPSTAAAGPDHPRLAELLREIEEVDRQAREVAGALSLQQLTWRPGEAWGIGDCLEHLTVTAELYLPRVQAAVEAARSSRSVRTPVPAGTGPRAWRRTVSGRFLLWGINSPRKLPAPKVFRPPDSPRLDVLDAFLGTQAQVADLVRAVDTLPIERIRFSSPVSSFVRLHAGEAFEVLEAHARRHLAQARRAREHAGFPAA